VAHERLLRLDVGT
jgi:serine/threonine-protein kinase HipA